MKKSLIFTVFYNGVTVVKSCIIMKYKTTATAKTIKLPWSSFCLFAAHAQL